MWYLFIAAAVYMFLWLIHIVSDPKSVTDIEVQMIDVWWVRMLASALWPALFILIGWKFYEERQDN